MAFSRNQHKADLPPCQPGGGQLFLFHKPVSRTRMRRVELFRRLLTKGIDDLYSARVPLALHQSSDFFAKAATGMGLPALRLRFSL